MTVVLDPTEAAQLVAPDGQPRVAIDIRLPDRSVTAELNAHPKVPKPDGTQDGARPDAPQAVQASARPAAAPAARSAVARPGRPGAAWLDAAAVAQERAPSGARWLDAASEQRRQRDAEFRSRSDARSAQQREQSAAWPLRGETA